jgi:competence protein ComGC
LVFHTHAFSNLAFYIDAAGDSIPYLVVLAVVNVTALIVANIQAYRARNVRTDFSESSYIAMANASFLQAICICLPIIFLTKENPMAYYIVVSVVLFILCGAILIFIFVPKVFALKERKKNKGKAKANVKVTGLNLTSQTSNVSKTGSVTGSGALQRKYSQATHGSMDEVTALLQQYQKLSWENKVAVKKKLGFAASSSRSLEEFDSTSLRSKEESGVMDPVAEQAMEDKVEEVSQASPTNTSASDSSKAEHPTVDEAVP